MVQHRAQATKDNEAKRLLHAHAAHEYDQAQHEQPVHDQLAGVPGLLGAARQAVPALGSLAPSVVGRLQRLVGNASVTQMVQRTRVAMGQRIGGYGVTRHAEERADERGVTREQMAAAVTSGGKYNDADSGGIVYYDSATQLAVVVQGSSIVTTYFGAFKRRRWTPA